MRSIGVMRCGASWPRSTLRRRSLHLTKNLTSSMGGYLPNTLTEMWEPSRDFAYLKLPTSGARCIVALSGYVLQPSSLQSIVPSPSRSTRLEPLPSSLPSPFVLPLLLYFPRRDEELIRVCLQVGATGHGRVIGGIFLFVQHRSRERRGVLVDEAILVRLSLLSYLR